MFGEKKNRYKRYSSELPPRNHRWQGLKRSSALQAERVTGVVVRVETQNKRTTIPRSRANNAIPGRIDDEQSMLKWLMKYKGNIITVQWMDAYTRPSNNSRARLKQINSETVDGLR